MIYLHNFQDQVMDAWTKIAPQMNHIWTCAKEKIKAEYDSIEYNTDCVAKYIFAIDRSDRNKDIIFNNVGKPLISIGIPCIFYFGMKPAFYVATIMSIYTLCIAKKNGYF